jgi:hypothetical protein
VLFAAVLSVQVGGVAGAAAGQDAGPLRWWGALLLTIAAAAVPLRLAHPAAAAWVAKLATLLYWSLDTPRGPAFVALVITFVNVVYAGRRTHAVAIAGTGIVGFAWLGPLIGDQPDPTVIGVVATAGWVGALAGAGEALRSTRDRRHANQRARVETVQRQVAEERIRIARDLHDVVAHNMSLIKPCSRPFVTRGDKCKRRASRIRPAMASASPTGAASGTPWCMPRLRKSRCLSLLICSLMNSTRALPPPPPIASTRKP